MCDRRGCQHQAEAVLIDFSYSLVVEATADPSFFGFYSTELEGFTGMGHSVEDCLYEARAGMTENVQLLRDRRLPVPLRPKNPIITIRNERKRKSA